MTEEISEECYEGEHDWGKPEDLGNDVWRVKCKRCGEEYEDVLFVEYWKSKTMTVAGKTYKALKRWGNILRCSECDQPIFDVPLMLWDSNDTSKALAFCWGCAKKLGLLDLLTRRRT